MKKPGGCPCCRGKPATPIRHYTTDEYEAQIAATRAAHEAEISDLTYGITIYLSGDTMALTDPIDATARALHNLDCGCQTYGETPDEDEALHYYSLAQAAADILIPAGREAAAKAIEADAARIARGDNS